MIEDVINMDQEYVAEFAGDYLVGAGPVLSEREGFYIYENILDRTVRTTDGNAEMLLLFDNKNEILKEIKKMKKRVENSILEPYQKALDALM